MDAVAAAWPDLHLVRRVITRPEEAGGEAFDGVSEDAFAERVAAGQFLLHWRAHGLRYGIPGAVGDVLAQGRPAMVNLSRAVLREAQVVLLGGKAVLSLTARPEVLANRLAGRGRENAEEIAHRLARASFALPDGLARVVTLDNSGTLTDTVAAVLAAFQTCEEVTE